MSESVNGEVSPTSSSHRRDILLTSMRNRGEESAVRRGDGEALLFDGWHDITTQIRT